MSLKNSVNASVEFHYRGELYSASITVELDPLMENKASDNAEVLSSLHHFLATKMGIDKYSYQFEMMQAEEICFSEAQGMAVKHLQDGHFDIHAFEKDWRENKMLDQLQHIASRLLGVDDLKQRPELKNALLEAYQIGREQP